MKAVLAIVTCAIALTAIGGVGWIGSAVAEADGARIVFQYILVGAVVTTLASLAVAMIVGLWHLYLFLFTEKKPVSLFASIGRDDE